MALGGTDYYATHNTDEEQRYTTQHKEMHALLCDNFKWSMMYKNAEPLMSYNRN